MRHVSGVSRCPPGLINVAPRRVREPIGFAYRPAQWPMRRRTQPSSLVSKASSTSDAASKAAILDAPGRTLRVHYMRRDQNYKGWGLHVWGDSKEHTEWASPLEPSTSGSKLTWTLELIPEQAKNNFNHWVGLQVHKGDEKDARGSVMEVSEALTDLYFVSGSLDVFTNEPVLDELPIGCLSKAAAHWVEEDLIVWRIPTEDSGQPRKFKLVSSQSAGLELGGPHGCQGHDSSWDLRVLSQGVDPGVVSRFPHLSGCSSLSLPGSTQVKDLLKTQLAVVALDENELPIDVTGIQVQGVLDDLCFYSGPLGSEIGSNQIAIRLWAPTATEVTLLLWEESEGGSSFEIGMKEENGVWAEEVNKEWLWKYYTYRIQVYDVWTQTIQTFHTTDPYSRSLAADGARTQIVDLDDPALKPEGWDRETPPENSNYQHPVDMSVYELHIRDFSISDPDIAEQHRGKYAAFSEETHGTRHLQALHAAGLTHVHLLPSYDLGSVPEKPEDQQEPEGDLSSFGPDSEEQQKRVLSVADRDGFNWGYDPVHYGVPEGSYASNPNGWSRVLEFRKMVQGLHRLGLGVVLDVVYNHTFHSGLDGVDSKYAVFDKIVPGYYHRRTETGDLCTSACCNNTAPEHLMFERLMVDDIVHWTKTYKVDGFRWDIMGHLMLRNMTKVLEALAALTLEKDGVDGSRIQQYAEAWSFGEVAYNQRGRNASQANVGGTGIGSFNDRFRDAAMGGSPFASAKHQGWVTGLYTQPSEFTQKDMDEAQQREVLLDSGDLLKLSLAGLMRDYEIQTWKGDTKPGKKMFYGPQIAGYCVQPWENVNYASCHDGETLFDQVIEKAAEGVGLDERIRMHGLAHALVAFGQGIAFFHAGCDILRSKSLDRDSYNSGDWFNRLDWTLQSNNFGVGLPVATKNMENWDSKRLLLADPRLKPGSKCIQDASDRFRELLEIRYSSPLFRLRSREEVQSQLTFLNTGPDQTPGVIVMVLTSAELVGGTAGTQDSQFKRIITVFNALPDEFRFECPEGIESLQMHPVQQRSIDERLKEVQILEGGKGVCVIPGRTAVVLVELR